MRKNAFVDKGCLISTNPFLADKLERIRFMEKNVVREMYARQFIEKEWEAMGQRIKQARLNAGIKQVDLGRFLGIEKNQIYRIEKGVTPCKTEYLYEISQILGVSLDYLYFGKNEHSEVREVLELCKGKSLKELQKAADILRAFFGCKDDNCVNCPAK